LKIAEIYGGGENSDYYSQIFEIRPRIEHKKTRKNHFIFPLLYLVRSAANFKEAILELA